MVMVLEITRKILAKEKYFVGYTTNDELTVPDVNPLVALWDQVHKIKKDITECITDGNEIGINLNMASKSKKFKYFTGVEATTPTSNPTLETYTLRATEYLVCQFEAENFHTLITEAISKAYAYMDIWIKNRILFTKIEHIAYEVYYHSTPKSAYMELWILLKKH
jgi:AraC family transcriptional regulator